MVLLQTLNIQSQKDLIQVSTLLPLLVVALGEMFPMVLLTKVVDQVVVETMVEVLDLVEDQAMKVDFRHLKERVFLVVMVVLMAVLLEVIQVVEVVAQVPLEAMVPLTLPELAVTDTQFQHLVRHSLNHKYQHQ
jgi:hypothetical protein